MHGSAGRRGRTGSAGVWSPRLPSGARHKAEAQRRAHQCMARRDREARAGLDEVAHTNSPCTRDTAASRSTVCLGPEAALQLVLGHGELVQRDEAVPVDVFGRPQTVGHLVKAHGVHKVGSHLRRDEGTRSAGCGVQKSAQTSKERCPRRGPWRGARSDLLPAELLIAVGVEARKEIIARFSQPRPFYGS